MKRNGNRSFGKILLVLMIIFFYLPILYMIIFSLMKESPLPALQDFHCAGMNICWNQEI